MSDGKASFKVNEYSFRGNNSAFSFLPPISLGINPFRRKLASIGASYCIYRALRQGFWPSRMTSNRSYEILL